MLAPKILITITVKEGHTQIANASRDDGLPAFATVGTGAPSRRAVAAEDRAEPWRNDGCRVCCLSAVHWYRMMAFDYDSPSVPDTAVANVIASIRGNGKPPSLSDEDREQRRLEREFYRLECDQRREQRPH